MATKTSPERKIASAPNKKPTQAAARVVMPNQLPPISTALPRGSNFAPSSAPAATGAGDPALASFQNDKRFTGTWSANQPRSAWVYVEAIGWRQLADNSDVVNQALAIVAGHAHAQDRSTSYVEGDDGKIRELYVF